MILRDLAITTTTGDTVAVAGRDESPFSADQLVLRLTVTVAGQEGAVLVPLPAGSTRAVDADVLLEGVAVAVRSLDGLEVEGLNGIVNGDLADEGGPEA